MLPNYHASAMAGLKDGTLSYGLQRLDHAVSNVPNLFEAVDYLSNALGLHEFSEFTTEDVGTGTCMSCICCTFLSLLDTTQP